MLRLLDDDGDGDDNHDGGDDDGDDDDDDDRDDEADDCDDDDRGDDSGDDGDDGEGEEQDGGHDAEYGLIMKVTVAAIAVATGHPITAKTQMTMLLEVHEDTVRKNMVGKDGWLCMTTD